MNPIQHILNLGKRKRTSLNNQPKVVKARKVIGFSGSIDHLLDYDLLQQLVAGLPMFDFHFIGPIKAYKSALQLDAFPNVQFYGSQTSEDSQLLVNDFDIAILPYAKSTISNGSRIISRLTNLVPNTPVVTNHFFGNNISPVWNYVETASDFVEKILSLQLSENLDYASIHYEIEQQSVQKTA